MSPQTAGRVDLPVTGMSCAACARSIEHRLSATPGVAGCATSISPRPQPPVEFDPARTAVGDLVGAIEELGYAVPQPEPGVDIEEQSRQQEYTAIKRRLLLAAAFFRAGRRPGHVARTDASCRVELDSARPGGAGSKHRGRSVLQGHLDRAAPSARPT